MISIKATKRKTTISDPNFLLDAVNEALIWNTPDEVRPMLSRPAGRADGGI